MTPSKPDHSSVITVSGKAHPVFSALHSIFIWTFNINERQHATICGMPALFTSTQEQHESISAKYN